VFEDWSLPEPADSVEVARCANGTTFCPIRPATIAPPAEVVAMACNWWVSLQVGIT